MAESDETFDLRTGFLRSGLSLDELWYRCLELGAPTDRFQMEAEVFGAGVATAGEHNTIAQALNEYFVDLGGCWPVGYRPEF